MPGVVEGSSVFSVHGHILKYNTMTKPDRYIKSDAAKTLGFVLESNAVYTESALKTCLLPLLVLKKINFSAKV